MVELYDLTSDSWTLLPALSGSLTGSPALITAGLRTYLLGGYGQVTSTSLTTIMTRHKETKAFYVLQSPQLVRCLIPILQLMLIKY